MDIEQVIGQRRNMVKKKNRVFTQKDAIYQWRSAREEKDGY